MMAEKTCERYWWSCEEGVERQKIFYLTAAREGIRIPSMLDQVISLLEGLLSLYIYYHTRYSYYHIPWSFRLPPHVLVAAVCLPRRS